MKAFVLLFLSMSFTGSAHALNCRENVAPNPQLCRIHYAGSPPCSGLYLGNGKVLTAGHCLVNARPRAVTCVNGYQGSVVRSGIWIHEEYLKGPETPEERAAVDLAILTIAPAAGVEEKPSAIAIPASAEVAWRLAKNGDCTMNGVGRDQSEAIGQFQSCASSPVQTQLTDAWLQTVGPNFGKSSDSGGPLICRAKSGQMLVVGVLSRGQNATGSTYFAPVHQGKLP